MQIAHPLKLVEHLKIHIFHLAAPCVYVRWLLLAGIFAISGPTGAGKSTLGYDVLSSVRPYAPCTDQAKENNVKLQDVSNEQLSQSDPRFLLRRGTSSGFAEVDFMALERTPLPDTLVGGAGTRQGNGRLQNPRLALYNLDKEEEEQGTRSDLQARIIDLIGLTFSNSLRMGNGKPETCSFQPGSTMTEESSKTGQSGYHCCDHPFGCLDYYGWNGQNRF